MQKQLMAFGLSLLLAGQIQASWQGFTEFVDGLCGNTLQNKIAEYEAELVNCKTTCQAQSDKLASINAFDKSLLTRFALGIGVDKIVRDSSSCTGCSKTATSFATQFAINYLLFDRGILRGHQAHRTWSDAALFAIKASAIYLSTQVAHKKIAKYFSDKSEEETSAEVA